MQSPDGGKVAGEAAGCESRSMERLKEGRHELGCDFAGVVACVLVQERPVFFQVERIGRERIGGEAALQAEELQVFSHLCFERR